MTLSSSEYNLSSKCTILISSCDSYSDVASAFLASLWHHWPSCPFQLVISRESSDLLLPANSTRHHPKHSKDKWGQRIKRTLSFIDTPYVMFLFDDFILNRSIDDACLMQAFNILSDPANAVVYLTQPHQSFLKFSSPCSSDPFLQIAPFTQYTISSRPAVWSKSALDYLTKHDDTPWSWEVFGSFRSWHTPFKFYALNPDVNSIYSYDNHLGGAIYRGKWVRSVVDYLDENLSLELNYRARGIIDEAELPKRSLYWKLKFILVGIRTSGIRTLYIFFPRISSLLRR